MGYASPPYSALYQRGNRMKTSGPRAAEKEVASRMKTEGCGRIRGVLMDASLPMFYSAVREMGGG
jgi:hypothetical protein